MLVLKVALKSSLFSKNLPTHGYRVVYSYMYIHDFKLRHFIIPMLTCFQLMTDHCMHAMPFTKALPQLNLCEVNIRKSILSLLTYNVLVQWAASILLHACFLGHCSKLCSKAEDLPSMLWL